MRALFAFVVLGTLTACAPVGQNFSYPDITLDAQFVNAGSTHLRETIDPNWWRGLNDPLLNALVPEGLEQNLDIQIARERIVESEALLRSSGVISRLSGDLTASARRARADGITENAHQIGLGVGFGLDLFGERKRRREAAPANVMQAVYASAVTRLEYQRALVAAYLNVRYFQTAVRLRQRAIANRRELIAVSKESADIGEETRVGVRRAAVLAAVEDVQSDLTLSHSWALRVKALTSAVAIYRDVTRLSRETYELSWVDLNISSGHGWDVYHRGHSPEVKVAAC